MALPELLLPASLSPFLAVEHAHEPISIYTDIEWRTGHNSKRRTYTSAPRIVSVSLDLSQAQTTDFYYWFENAAKVGTEWFSAQLANFGPGLLWFRSRFFEPYVATPDTNGLRWQIKFRLLVTGEGSEAAPIPTSYTSTRTVDLNGRASIIISRQFSSTRTLALTSFAFLTSTRRLILKGVPDDNYFILEDGTGFLLMEDDSLLLEEA